MRGKERGIAAKTLDKLAAKLTPAQLSKAQMRETKWLTEHPTQS